MIITKISFQQNSDRLNIFIDEQFAFGVDQDVFIRYELKKGMELTSQLVTEMLHADEIKKAYNISLHFLSYRMRSIKEVIDFLKKKEIVQEVIDEVISKLLGQKYVNDQQFANAYVSTQINTTLKGPNIVRSELVEKGILPSLIEQAIEQYTEEIAYEKARKLVEKSERSSKKISHRQQIQQLEQLLFRKGYEESIIRNVTKESTEVDEDHEWESLIVHGEKMLRKYRHLPEFELHYKVKQQLYQKGFSLDLISRFLKLEKEAEE